MNNFLSEITLRWIKEENEAYKRERERIKKLAIKEANKVKKIDYRKLPYFEVVKVEKEKEFICPDSGRAICLTCGEKLYHIEKPKVEPKGNWVNNENLDKIKFPCFCSYRSHTGKKHYAQLNMDRANGKDKFTLLRLFQADGENIFLSSDSLKKLIRKWDIHILKGKIILFDEEE